ncbi:MAG: tetratricopeptide repeat protein [Chthoniobacterales bacterium]|nr:tetratricopeptide repeat protein [Chthoniobacterales bacterium]
MIILLGVAPLFLHAESEGLVKQSPITNNLLPIGSSTEQLAAADAFADAGDTQNAIKTYRYIARSLSKSTEAPTAQFGLAKQLKQSGNFEAAFKEYQSLLQNYPQTKNFEEAVADQIDIANAYLKGKKVKFLGIPLVSSMEKSEEMYAAILKVSPYSKHAAITQFNLGLALQKQGKAQEAIAAYQKVLDKYPNSAACDSAAYQVGYVYQLLGMTGKSQDLSALKEAQNNYQDFLLQYPNSEKIQQAGQNMKKMLSKESADTLRVARFYDFNKDFKASSIYYNDVIRRFPQSEEATAAKSRLDELKALYGEDTLRVGQERPENGERLAERRRLQAQVESTALANYDGPPKKDIVRDETPLPQPRMKGDLRDTQPIPLQEPPAQTPVQKTPLAP